MSVIFLEWLMISSIILMAVISPGPDLVVTLRNAVMYSRRAGIMTALGIALGVGIHVSYCIIGVAALIAHSPALFSVIKYCGAAYLIYIGIKALRSKGTEQLETGDASTATVFGASRAFRSGFLTNLLNPKATLFFFALFTQVIDPQTPVSIQVLYGLTAVLTSALWFSIVAFWLTDSRIKGGFLRFSKLIDRATGGLLVALGIRLALLKG